MGYLKKDPNAVACLAKRVLSGAVLKLFNYGQSIIKCPVFLFSVNIHYKSDATGIMLFKKSFVLSIKIILLFTSHQNASSSVFSTPKDMIGQGQTKIKYL